MIQITFAILIQQVQLKQQYLIIIINKQPINQIQMIDEKKMLIQSMKKLIVHISNNKEHQNQIYRSLTKNDINKILSNLEDNNIVLRKMSARLLCQLLYQNQQIKEMFINTMNVYPMHGNIILNKFPETIKNRPEIILGILNYLKSVKPDLSNKNICWYIDPQRNEIFLQYATHNTFIMNDFLDSNRVIFGFSFQKTQHHRRASSEIQTPTAIGAKKNKIEINRPIQTRQSINSSNIDKFTRTPKQQVNIHKFSQNNGYDNRIKKQQISLTERYNKANDEIKYYNNNINIKDNPQNSNRRYTEEIVLTQDRLRTDQSDNSGIFKNKNKPQGIKIISATTNGNTIISPQNNQHQFKFIDKVLKEKGNNKQDKHFIILGRTKQTNNPVVNGSLTQREPRQSFQLPVSKNSNISNYLIKSNNYNMNNYNQQFHNYNQSIPDAKIQYNKPEGRFSHELSYEGNYKTSETFLKKMKQSSKK